MVRMVGGKPRPFGDDKPKKGRVALLTAAIVGAAAAGGTAISAGGSTASVGSGGGSSLKARGSSKESARKGRHEEAMTRLGLKKIKKLAKRELKCAPYAFGQVQDFLVRHPCKALTRMLLAVGDEGGNTVVVTIAWVRMPKTAEARDLRKLTDRDGTGNIYALPDALLERSGIRFTGDHYASRLDGALLVIAEATGGNGHPDPVVLQNAADVAVEFPAP
ncbi:hypothetical protein [Amycolatopsis sp. SID8362]|uniref:hypothetical protein n=1 Tax=Amycolatopsis sp. SID8362 TaxID=2690346 RepID=UPI00136F5311|nr:hypothetical protein [Amycolatopsis sp. SID8362]NBH07155.1 hypothetical protein [Amycolatopsis sp. SID8362]NED43851.1 hypothetical protein [Amycolatopsis sp. SID8362]